jgi:hypothetical protein
LQDIQSSYDAARDASSLVDFSARHNLAVFWLVIQPNVALSLKRRIISLNGLFYSQALA